MCPLQVKSTDNNSTDNNSTENNTLIVVVSSLGAFLLASTLVVVALLCQTQRRIKRLAALTMENLEHEAEPFHGDNEGMHEPSSPQEQAATIIEEENLYLHTDQNFLKSSVDIPIGNLSSPPIAFAELIVPLPPPPPST